MNTPTTRAAAGRASLLIALSACAFGSIAILTTFALGTGAPLLSVLTWRYLLAAVVLLAIAAGRGLQRPDGTGLRVMAAGGLAQATIAVVSLSALRYIPAGTLSFLFYTYPAWVAIIARIRHSEPLTPARMTALGLSLAGIFTMVGAPGAASLHPGGVAMALVSALLYAAYIPMIDAYQRKLTPLVTSMYVCGGAGVLLLLAALTRAELTVALHATAWKAITAMALWSTVIAFLMFLRGLAVLGAVRTAIISTIEPFFTALLGAWLLRQPLTRTTFFGGALIAAAVVLLQVRGANNGRVDS